MLNVYTLSAGLKDDFGVTITLFMDDNYRTTLTILFWNIEHNVAEHDIQITGSIFPVIEVALTIKTRLVLDKMVSDVAKLIADS